MNLFSILFADQAAIDPAALPPTIVRNVDSFRLRHRGLPHRLYDQQAIRAFLRQHMEADDWPGTSYGPDHRWAIADVADARGKMRYRFEHRLDADPHAHRLSEAIANRYAEGRVMRRFRDAIGVAA